MTLRVKMLLAALLVAGLGVGVAFVAFPGRAATAGLGRPHQHLTGDEIDIYGATLRHYLAGTTQGVPVFVVGRIDGSGSPVTAGDRTKIAAEVGAPVEFVENPEDVLVRIDGCAQIRDHGIAVTLTQLRVTGRDRVEVPLSDFVACLGAGSRTYVVEYASGRWRVTGDTGVYANS